jgi:hypothetical protein
VNGKFFTKRIIPYRICNNQEQTHLCLSVFSMIPLNISFRRGLVGNNLINWHNLVARVANTRLMDSDDKFICGCTRMMFSQLNQCT